MVDARDDVASAPVSYSRNMLGLFGFAAALLGLIFFWVPIAGVAFWALGLGLAFGGCFKVPRGYGFTGIFVSLISFVFMGYFLVLPSWLAEPVEKIVHGEALSEKKSGSGQAASAGTPNRTLSDILSSFRYDEAARGAAGTPPVADSEPAEVADDEPVAGEEIPDPEEIAENHGEAGSAFDLVGEVGPSYRLPLAKFPEIAKKRTLWPRRVMLTRARTISLWDSDRKEIMGKMEIPAKTVVEVLDVRADGSLFVLDCTSQAFVVLAADTDFARVYLEKNRKTREADNVDEEEYGDEDFE
ncbi:MAG: FUSC family protein [Opitutales bacterium]|nr:FUSC family protein [Opitutales bacterium]